MGPDGVVPLHGGAPQSLFGVEAGVEQEAGSQLHAQQTQLLVLSRLENK